MTESTPLAGFVSLTTRPAWSWAGSVVEADALLVQSEGPPCAVGDTCELLSADGSRHAAEVVGFRGRRILSMPLEAPRGVRAGDRVLSSGHSASISVSEAMTGHVFDALGRPLTAGFVHSASEACALDAAAAAPLDREPIAHPLHTGIRAIDSMLQVGRGQRMGIFGGSGVGKSTLIGMMTRNTSADITVVGLVGERGREVQEFLRDALGEQGRASSVVMVATSDQSPLLRLRCALAATAVAEFHARRGKHVLLVLDSLTRFAMAAREIGLAAGEPPTSKGYTPSVFTRLARLVERAGSFRDGSITAFYTVLMEGDDQQDPIVDAVRSLIDGHIVLSRELAAEGWYPPIKILDSLSRLMPAVGAPRHLQIVRLLRKRMADADRSADLVRLGAYTRGSDAELDAALAAMPEIRAFLEQDTLDCAAWNETLTRLEGLAL